MNLASYWQTQKFNYIFKIPILVVAVLARYARVNNQLLDTMAIYVQM